MTVQPRSRLASHSCLKRVFLSSTAMCKALDGNHEEQWFISLKKNGFWCFCCLQSNFIYIIALTEMIDSISLLANGSSVMTGHGHD